MSIPFNITFQSVKPTPLPMKRSKRRDEYTKAMESIDIGVIANSITDELAVVKDQLDRNDVGADLIEIAQSIETPTENELKLLDIAQYMSKPTNELDLIREAPALETYSGENFITTTAALEQRLQIAQESVLSTMADVWTAFKGFLSKIAFKLRSYSSQVSKLRSVLANLRQRSNKTTINAELKASALMYSGKDDSYALQPLVNTKSMADGLITYLKHYDQFATAYSGALYTYSSRYASAFTTLFNAAAREDLFFDELKKFSDSFFTSVIRDGDLKIAERKGLVVINRSPVGICGSYFGVTAPGENIFNGGAIHSVLRSFDEFKIHASDVSFDPARAGKTKVISVNLNDVEAMLDALDVAMGTLDTLVTDRLLKNIEDLEQFVDTSVPLARYDEETGVQTTASKIEQTVKVAEIAFKKTNAVARLQVMQAEVAISGFRSIYDGLISKLDQVIPLCYEALNKKEWFDQEMGI